MGRPVQEDWHTHEGDEHAKSAWSVRSRRRLGAAVAAVGLMAFVAQGWVPRVAESVPANSECWPHRARPKRSRPGAPGDAGGIEAERAGIDVNGVVDTVRHHVRPIDGRPGALEARDDAYRAFDGAGFAVDGLGVNCKG